MYVIIKNADKTFGFISNEVLRLTTAFLIIIHVNQLLTTFYFLSVNGFNFDDEHTCS